MTRIFFLLMLIFFWAGCSDKPKGDVTHEPGEVVKFDWHDVVPGYSESTEHMYGFDKDPMGLINPDYFHDVYVSVKNGEVAKVVLNLPNKSHTSYSLIDLNSGVTMGAWNAIDEMPIELPVGKYALYGDGINLDRYVTVVGYDEKNVDIEYIQFDGEDECLDKGCYTYEKVRAQFDNVYKQAVTYGTFIAREPAFYGFGNMLVVDMTKHIEGEFFENLAKEIMTKARSSCTIYTDEESFHTCWSKRIALGINSFRLVWFLQDQVSGNIMLQNYYDLFMAMRENGAAMYLRSSSELCPDRSFGPIRVYPNIVFFVTDTDVASVSLEDEKGRNIAYDQMCDYLYIDAHSFVPGIHGAAQVTLPFYDASGKYIDAGVSWAGRQEGEASFNTILHEIGHTFGLSDLVAPCSDPSIPCDDKGNIEKYTTTEANLMNYIVPTGPRLRYRDVQVAATKEGVAIVGRFDSQWECIQKHEKCVMNGGDEDE